MDEFYGNALKSMMTNPGGFSGTPGFKFALNTGLDAVGRQNSRNRGSGNALAALTQYGTGLAQQDWGNQVDRLGRLQGQQQQFQLGMDSNANQRQSIDNQRLANDNQFQLGQTQNALSGQRDFWNYDLGRESNSMQAANARNQWNINPNRWGQNTGGNGIQF